MRKSIKTIVVILAIILFCGGLLAVLSDLLRVEDSERIQRAIDKIYVDEEVALDGETDISAFDVSAFAENGVIKACYKLDNGDYLVLSTGKKGYSNGTVTLYVAVSTNDGEIKVKSVAQDGYTGQTLMSKLADLYGRFTDKTADETEEEVSEIVSGATYSSTAASNAVYVALQFVKLVSGGAL